MKLKVGSKLLQIREDRKLSQAEMADLLGISQSSYSRFEKDDTSVEFERLASFANALSVPLQDLLPETISVRNHTSGQGSVIFGNCTNYNFYDSDAAQQHKQLAEQNEQLMKENQK